jgi:hypothetical protein
MNGKTVSLLAAFVLLARVGFAGTEVGYELITSQFDQTAAAVAGDAEIEFEDRVWAVPGVEQLVPKSDLVVAAWSESGIRFEFKYEVNSPIRWAEPRFAVRLPQWVDEIIWPLTRELWGGLSDPPQSPNLRLGRLDGMVLATQR